MEQDNKSNRKHFNQMQFKKAFRSAVEDKNGDSSDTIEFQSDDPLTLHTGHVTILFRLPNCDNTAVESEIVKSLGEEIELALKNIPYRVGQKEPNPSQPVPPPLIVSTDSNTHTVSFFMYDLYTLNEVFVPYERVLSILRENGATILSQEFGTDVVAESEIHLGTTTRDYPILLNSLPAVTKSNMDKFANSPIKKLFYEAEQYGKYSVLTPDSFAQLFSQPQSESSHYSIAPHPVHGTARIVHLLSSTAKSQNPISLLLNPKTTDPARRGETLLLEEFSTHALHLETGTSDTTLGDIHRWVRDIAPLTQTTLTPVRLLGGEAATYSGVTVLAFTASEFDANGTMVDEFIELQLVIKNRELYQVILYSRPE